ILGVAAITVAVLVLFKKKVKEVPENISNDYAEEVFSEIEWIEIQAGEFLMGDNHGYGEHDELPVHKVYLDSYKISKLEITFEQFDKYSRATQLWDPSSEGWGREDRPVINVRWGEVLMFCEWLSEYTKKKIMIPTEAQWEKAAIGTSTVIYPWGNSAPGCSRTNYNNCIGKTEPVGSYPLDISVYGVLNMGGNAAELVRDGYQADYYSISPYNNPEGPDLESTDYRVVKGGNWSSNDLRASNRSSLGKFSRNERTGFRIVWID
ncbi:MAG: SUMF1/EgtB/PvdO family nonheme iron enzyme, partial [Candidatus Aminicenantes bacterium]|nr:SUMF1/EgtB/PvdO family nonheme iron enzyme [Candidatus Aminicenantes bacterium]